MGQIYQAERKLEELALEESLKRDLLEIEMRSEQKAPLVLLGRGKDRFSDACCFDRSGSTMSAST